MINDVAQVVISVCTLGTFVITIHTLLTVKDVVRQTNHIKDELVQEVRKSSFAAGQKQQQQQQDTDVY